MTSIIITSCDADHQYLRRALGSCLVQDTEVEIIVIHSGRTIATLLTDVIPDKYITVPDQGLSYARNLGIGMAKFDFIICIEADDWLYPDVLGAMENELKGVNSVCFGNMTGKDKEMFIPDGWRGVTRELLLAGNPIPVTSMFRKSAWKMVGGFPDVTYSDYAYWVKIYKAACGFVYIDKTVFHHTYRTDSYSFRVKDNAEELNKQAIEPLL
jgi:glycosyltransferase involved in cell wall biosynthesis